MKFSKKSLGQNFLIDKNIIKKIVNLVNIENKNIIEIGPGYGALTEEIVKKKPKSFSIIEKDFYLSEGLKSKYSKNKNIIIHNDDILKIDIESMIKKDSIILGNLPYNIASQILIKILKLKKWPPKFNDLVFMFQKEVGDKIVGRFSSSDYGRLSIISNYRLNILNKFLISPNCFRPKPKITSMVIHFKPKKNIYSIREIDNLEKITNVFFSNKRKMINKSVKKLFYKDNVEKILDIKLNLRPSDIKPEIYYKITQLYEK